MLYEDLKSRKGVKIFTKPAFFILRRLLLVLVVTSSEVLVAIIYAVITSSLVDLLMMEYLSAFKSRSLRLSEIFNEVTIMLVMYTILCFTPWIEDKELQGKIGCICCGLVSFPFIANTGIGLAAGIRDSTKKYKIKVTLGTQMKVTEKNKTKRRKSRDSVLERMYERRREFESGQQESLSFDETA